MLITPLGRFCFNRMPFRVKSAAGHYQKKMTQLLEGQDGVISIINDILIHRRTQEEHDQTPQCVRNTQTSRSETQWQEMRVLKRINKVSWPHYQWRRSQVWPKENRVYQRHGHNPERERRSQILGNGQPTWEVHSTSGWEDKSPKRSPQQEERIHVGTWATRDIQTIQDWV